LLATFEAPDLQAGTIDPAFRDDVLRGLAEPIPSIPARWLYDRRGSELFDDITRLEEYYPTRTETALLTRIMPDIVAALRPGMAVVEFGAGSATKTPLLLGAIHPAAYVPIDISGDYLHESAFPGASGGRRFHQRDQASGRDRGNAQAGLLPGLDHRQLRAAQRDRLAAPLPPDAGDRREAADRDGPGETGRSADRGL
jgi:hypothetical protein